MTTLNVRIDQLIDPGCTGLSTQIFRSSKVVEGAGGKQCIHAGQQSQLETIRCNIKTPTSTRQN